MRAAFGSAALALILAASAAASPNLQSLVLGLHDLPARFTLDKAFVLSKAAVERESGWTAVQLRRWGWTTAYERDFSRVVRLPNGAKAKIELESSISAYHSPSGAQASLEQSGKRCRTAPSHRIAIGTNIGNEAFFCSRVTKSKGYTVQVYSLIWRRGRLKASVDVGGVKGGPSREQTVALAKLQDRRMRSTGTSPNEVP